VGCSVKRKTSVERSPDEHPRVISKPRRKKDSEPPHGFGYPPSSRSCRSRAARIRSGKPHRLRSILDPASQVPREDAVRLPKRVASARAMRYRIACLKNSLVRTSTRSFYGMADTPDGAIDKAPKLGNPHTGGNLGGRPDRCPWAFVFAGYRRRPPRASTLHDTGYGTAQWLFLACCFLHALAVLCGNWHRFGGCMHCISFLHRSYPYAP
jgi:hypothetical protein